MPPLSGSVGSSLESGAGPLARRPRLPGRHRRQRPRVSEPSERGVRPVSTHAIETGEHDWGVDSPALTMFDFDYQDGRDQLLRLYDKGTRRQWIGSDRIDWSGEVDPDNPLGVPDDIIPIVGTEWWNKMVRGRSRRGAPPPRVVAVQPVHARRAGRAHLHREDRADGARHRLEVLRGDAGDRRGPPRRGLQPLPARQDRASSTRSTPTCVRCSTTSSATAAGT